LMIPQRPYFWHHFLARPEIVWHTYNRRECEDQPQVRTERMQSQTNHG
jgi:hypothetical protein